MIEGVIMGVHGACDNMFKTVRDTLEANRESGEDLGASIVVNLDDQTVVDLWAADLDVAHGGEIG